MNGPNSIQVTLTRLLIFYLCSLAYLALTSGEATESDHMAAGVAVGVILLVGTTVFIISKISWMENNLPADQISAKLERFPKSIPTFFLILLVRFLALAISGVVLTQGMGIPEGCILSISAALAFYNPL